MNDYKRGEEIAADFEKLPQRVKEIYFEYEFVTHELNLQNDKNDLFRLFFELPHACDSPIEMIFYFSWYCITSIRKDKYRYLQLWPQKHVTCGEKEYVADFWVNIRWPYEKLFDKKEYNIIVECDGHEFHEATKEQVKKRNERDYNLKIAGYDVIHFSGSEIYNDPLKCAVKILKMYQKYEDEAVQDGDL